MAEKQVDLNLPKVSLTPTVQGGGRFATVIPKTPTTNSALRLSSGLANFSTVLGQYSNIQIRRGEEKAAAMSTEDVISAMENQQKGAGVPITERIGFQRGYAEGLYSRYLESKTIPRLNDLSLELSNLNADEIDAKDINEFDAFLEKRIKEVEDETLQYVDGNPFQMMIHGSVFDPVKTKFAIQERAKFAEKQNAWAVAREEEFAGTGFIDLLNAIPALEKDGTQDLTRLLPDEINRIIGGFEQKGLALNIAAGAKPKMLQRSLLRAVRTFVNDPNGIRADKFEQAKDFLEAATKSGAGKFKVFSSLSGKEAITQAYSAIDSAEKAFTSKNENFSKEVILSNSVFQEKQKKILDQKLGLAEGDPLDTLEFYKQASPELAEEMGLTTDREKNLLSTMLFEQKETLQIDRNREVAELIQNEAPANQFKSANNENMLIRRLYADATIAEQAENPLFTTYSIPGAFASKGSLSFPTKLVADELSTFVEASFKNIDDAITPQVEKLLKDRSLSKKEKEDAVEAISKDVLEKETAALEAIVRDYVSDTFNRTDPISDAKREQEKEIEKIQSEKGMERESAEILYKQNQRSKSEGKTFENDKNGELEVDIVELKDRELTDTAFGGILEDFPDPDGKRKRRISSNRVTDRAVARYKQTYENSRDQSLLIDKEKSVDKIFENLRLLRINNREGLRPRARRYAVQNGLFSSAPDINEKVKIESEIKDILSQQGGITEGEALEGKIFIKTNDNFRASEDEFFPFPIRDYIKRKAKETVILRLNTINKFNNNDPKAVERVKRIIDLNSIDSTPSDFVLDQFNVYYQATLPVLPE